MDRVLRCGAEGPHFDSLFPVRDFFSLKFLLKRRWGKWKRTTTTRVIPCSLADGLRQKDDGFIFWLLKPFTSHWDRHSNRTLALSVQQEKSNFKRDFSNSYVRLGLHTPDLSGRFKPRSSIFFCWKGVRTPNIKDNVDLSASYFWLLGLPLIVVKVVSSLYVLI